MSRRRSPIALAASVLALSFLALRSPGLTVGLSLPKALTGLELGSPADRLTALRPKAHALDLLGEPEKKGRVNLLIEDLPDEPLLRQAQYTLVDGRLCAVRLLARGQSAEPLEQRARVVQGALAKWGASPERYRFVDAALAPEAAKAGKALPPSGALLWTRGEDHALLRFGGRRSAAESPTGRELPGFVDLLILRESCLALPELRAWKNGLSPAPAGKSAELFEELSATVRGPLFE